MAVPVFISVWNVMLLGRIFIKQVRSWFQVPYGDVSNSQIGKSSTNKRGMSIKKAIKRSREYEGDTEGSGKKQRIPTERIKIVLHNARGFDAVTEHDAVSLITSQKPEVFGILETHLREEDGTSKVNIPEDTLRLRSADRI